MSIEQPVLSVLDDLQWAGRSTGELLGFLDLLEQAKRDSARDQQSAALPLAQWDQLRVLLVFRQEAQRALCENLVDDARAASPTRCTMPTTAGVHRSAAAGDDPDGSVGPTPSSAVSVRGTWKCKMLGDRHGQLVHPGERGGCRVLCQVLLRQIIKVS